MPIHYLEPLIGNERAIGLDILTSEPHTRAVNFYPKIGKPALTDRLRLVQETEEMVYSVVLFYPGMQLTKSTDPWPRDLASIVIRIPDLLSRSVENQGGSAAVYIFDKSDSKETPLFIGGAKVMIENGEHTELIRLEEVELQAVYESKLYREKEVVVANTVWTVVVTAVDDTFEPRLLFVILGGAVIFAAGVFTAMWVYTNTRRIEKFTVNAGIIILFGLVGSRHGVSVAAVARRRHDHE